MSGEPAQRTPLVLVSNRGPVTFHAHGEVQRGSGGLVTALTGLASHREALWIASAMSEHDAEVSREHGGRAFVVGFDQRADGGFAVGDGGFLVGGFGAVGGEDAAVAEDEGDAEGGFADFGVVAL